MANGMYNYAKQSFLNGSIKFIDDTIKVALVSTGYLPDLSNHKFFSDISSSNVVGTPIILTNKSSTNGVAGADNVTFTAVPGPATINYLVVYKDTGTANTSNLILLIDTATNLPATSNGGDIAIAWDSGPNKLFSI